jgi:hypothetical protein
MDFHSKRGEVIGVRPGIAKPCKRREHFLVLHFFRTRAVPNRRSEGVVACDIDDKGFRTTLPPTAGHNNVARKATHCGLNRSGESSAAAPLSNEIANRVVAHNLGNS